MMSYMAEMATINSRAVREQTRYLVRPEKMRYGVIRDQPMALCGAC